MGGKELSKTPWHECFQIVLTVNNIECCLQVKTASKNSRCASPLNRLLTPSSAPTLVVWDSLHTLYTYTVTPFHVTCMCKYIVGLYMLQPAVLPFPLPPSCKRGLYEYVFQQTTRLPGVAPGGYPQLQQQIPLSCPPMIPLTSEGGLPQ